jgi:hypothetical protein
MTPSALMRARIWYLAALGSLLMTFVFSVLVRGSYPSARLAENV